MLKKIFWLILLALTIQFSACDAQRKIIIDTDTGGDDAAALMLAAKSPNVKILGVTVFTRDRRRNPLALAMGMKAAMLSFPLFFLHTD